MVVLLGAAAGMMCFLEQDSVFMSFRDAFGLTVTFGCTSLYAKLS